MIFDTSFIPMIIILAYLLISFFQFFSFFFPMQFCGLNVILLFLM
jgi:hypothetical protein